MTQPPPTAPEPCAGGGRRVSGAHVRVLRAVQVHDGDRLHDDGWVALEGDRVLAVGSGPGAPRLGRQ